MVGFKSTVCGRRITKQDKIFGKYKNYCISFINATLNISHREVGDENQGNEEEFEELTEKENLENK